MKSIAASSRANSGWPVLCAALLVLLGFAHAAAQYPTSQQLTDEAQRAQLNQSLNQLNWNLQNNTPPPKSLGDSFSSGYQAGSASGGGDWGAVFHRMKVRGQLKGLSNADLVTMCRASIRHGDVETFGLLRDEMKRRGLFEQNPLANYSSKELRTARSGFVKDGRLDFVTRIDAELARRGKETVAGK